jgi:hypothetical protein
MGALLVATVTVAAPYANPQLLIETDELARLLRDGGLRIVDLRRDADKGEAAYGSSTRWSVRQSLAWPVACGRSPARTPCSSES